MKTYFKVFGILALISLSLFPLLSFAGSMRTGDTVYIGSDEVVNNNLFAAGNTVEVSGIVEGDAFLAGSQIDISGEILGDVYVAGNTITISGQVHGNIYTAGQFVNVNAEVGHNIYAAGQTLKIDEAGIIGWNGYFAGMQLEILGRVSRDLAAACEICKIQGTIGRNVDIEVGTNNLELGPQAFIGGNLSYVAKESFVDENTEKVQGNVYYHLYAEHPEKEANPFVSYLFAVLPLILVGLVFIALFKNNIFVLSAPIQEKPLLSLGLGFVGLVVTPFVMVFLLAILIGWPLALMLLAGYVIFIYLSFLVSALWVGQLIFTKLFKQEKVSSILVMVVGVLVVKALVYIPVLGGLFTFAFLLLGFGSLLLVKYNFITKTLPKLKA